MGKVTVISLHNVWTSSFPSWAGGRVYFIVCYFDLLTIQPTLSQVLNLPTLTDHNLSEAVIELAVSNLDVQSLQCFSIAISIAARFHRSPRKSMRTKQGWYIIRYIWPDGQERQKDRQQSAAKHNDRSKDGHHQPRLVAMKIFSGVKVVRVEFYTE
jgi:hypothetical protein